MTDTKKDFVDTIREVFKDMVAEQEQDVRLAKAEEVLKTAEATISNLTDTISKRDEEIATAADESNSLKARVEELEAKARELEEQLTKATEDNEGLTARAEASEKELAGIAAERRLEVRIAELSEAKVAQAGEKLEEQKAKIRDMQDEEFASYKEELTSFRALLEEQLREETASTSEETAEETVEVAPAKISESTKEEAAVAALNVEGDAPTKEDQYLDMGKAMAARIAKSYE